MTASRRLVLTRSFNRFLDLRLSLWFCNRPNGNAVAVSRVLFNFCRPICYSDSTFSSKSSGSDNNRSINKTNNNTTSNRPNSHPDHCHKFPEINSNKMPGHKEIVASATGTESDEIEMPPTKMSKMEQLEHITSIPSHATLRFAKMTDQATTPTRGSKQAAGFDLYSAYDYVIPKKGKILAKTDIQIALPDGCYGRVAPRSGLAYKNFIDVGAGVIDQDYRGNVGVVMFNFSDEDFTIKRGDRIAQLILERIFIPVLEECQQLDETERGSGGYGSTGTK